jgi:DNA-binding SARP family transcriptional activator
VCSFGAERHAQASRRVRRDVPSSGWDRDAPAHSCKRLAVAAGNPVPREELINMLWPDATESNSRLGARLAVQRSSVRRILGGGVIGDRTSIRIDPTAVAVDLIAFLGARPQQ